jgi:hypothetical protein
MTTQPLVLIVYQIPGTQQTTINRIQTSSSALMLLVQLELDNLSKIANNLGVIPINRETQVDKQESHPQK